MEMEATTSGLAPLHNESANEYFRSFDNYRTNLVTLIAYLIGVPDRTLEETAVIDRETLAEIREDTDAQIIRALSILRNQIFLNYSELNVRRQQFILLDKMPDLIDTEAIAFLKKQGIDITNISSNASNVTTNVAYINQFILDRIDRIKKHIPTWVKYEYVRGLFLMSGCYSGHNGSNLKGKNAAATVKRIHEARGEYLQKRMRFPYQTFIVWPRPFDDDDGNILYNDAKLLKMLYGAHKDCFAATEYVIDAKQYEKDSIYEFLDEAREVAIFVDCENVDPFCFAATIANLDPENLTKIKKVVLYDDVNASTAWDHIASIVDIPIEKHDINRLLENKSLADVMMTAGVCEAFYAGGVESIILVSSDSDFWGLIRSLPNARFLVLNESHKTSNAIIEKLDEHLIKHCFMDRFAKDKVQQFKNTVLYKGLHQKIERFNETGEFLPLSVDELIRDIFYEANISDSELQIKKEKNDFYNNFLKKGFIIAPVEENGRLVFKMRLNRK